MATKKNKDRVDTTKDYHGVTIEVGGEILGKIKEWKPEPFDRTKMPEKIVNYDKALSTFSVPGKLAELWGPHLITTSGKSFMGLTALGELLQPGHLYIKSQLEMWGEEKTRKVCENCLAELVTTLEDMGYRVWFDKKSTIDEDLAAAHGVVVQDYKLSYVGRENKENE
jgi:hypothetical protein